MNTQVQKERSSQSHSPASYTAAAEGQLGEADGESVLSPPRSAVAITAENLYDHEAYWPNIVAMADSWRPQNTDRPRPKTLQGTLLRIERNGTARIDLARFGRVDVPIAQTDLVERANAVRKGDLFKHRGNLAMQIAPMLVRSDLERPGPNSSREIKSAENMLCVYADPRDEDFPKLAKAFAAWSADLELPVVLIAQNVGRDDLLWIHERLRENEWPAPYVYPERSATQTERLLREAPRGPWLQLFSREGRELLSAGFAGESSFDLLNGVLGE